MNWDLEDLLQYKKETIESGGVTNIDFWEGFSAGLLASELLSEDEHNQFCEFLKQTKS